MAQITLTFNEFFLGIKLGWIVIPIPPRGELYEEVFHVEIGIGFVSVLLIWR